MDSKEYEEWKAREEQHRKERRRRRYKRVTGSVVAQKWDGTDPPLKFENMIARWQNSVTRYYKLVLGGTPPEAAWDEARPSHHSKWDLLPEGWRSSLEEMNAGRP